MENQNSFLSISQSSNDNTEHKSTRILGNGYEVRSDDFYQGKHSIHIATIVSKDNAFYKAISGNSDAIELLIKAVNNRTRERDYFRLYCEMLDSSITEEEFDEKIKSNGDDYVINESDEPDEAKIKIALKLIKHINGINSIDDFTSLFSFNPKKIETILEK
jgi:predicted nucleotidyltransferase component of viral defense system